MKKLGKNLLVCLLAVGCFGGVSNAWGPLYGMKTKAGYRLVKVNDCVKIIGDAEHGPRVGAIMYIGSSEDSDEDAVFTIDVDDVTGQHSELIDIPANETEKYIIDVCNKY